MGQSFPPRPRARRWALLLTFVWGSCCCGQNLFGPPPASSSSAATASCGVSGGGCGTTFTADASVPDCGGCALGLTCDTARQLCVPTACQGVSSCPPGWQCVGGHCSEPTCQPACQAGVCVAGQCVFQGQGGPADAGPDAGPPTCALNGVSGVAAILVDRPLGYWRLGEDAGRLAADAIVGSPSGMYGASIALGLPGLWGYPGDVAASFPGGSFTTSSVVQVAQSDALQPDGGLTIEAWFRLGTPPPDQPGEVPSLVHQGSTLGPPPFTLDLDPLGSQIHFFVNTADGLRSLSSATPLHEGSAFHVVATFDGSTLALYLDGAIDARLAGTSSAILGYDGTSGLTLGGDPDQPDRPAFAGLLEDVAIYGTALSPARIEAHYQAAASGCVPQTALPDGGPDGGLDGGADAGADGGLEDGGTGDAGWEDAGEGGMLGDGGPLDAGGDGGAADAGA